MSVLFRYLLLILVLILLPFSRKIRNLIVFVFRNHSSKVPTKTIEEFGARKQVSKVLFVYPHPDDETMYSGGVIKLMTKSKEFEVFVISLSAGEEGKEILNETSEKVGAVRKKEFEKAMKYLGVKNYYVWDFPDTKIKQKADEIKKKLEEFIKENEIDSIVTYEKSGMYGHPDHVAGSKIVHEISEENKELKVFYSTLTEKLEKANATRQRIKDLELVDYEPNQKPEFKIMVLPSYFAKLRAARAYKSQKLSHKKELWEEIFSMPFEYYTTRWGKL